MNNLVGFKYQFQILINYFKKKLWKWLLAELILILAYLFLIGLDIKEGSFDPTSIINIISIKNIKDYQFLEYVIFLFNISLTFYITYSLYIYEYNNSLEFIALRINHKKRNITKLIMILSFIFFLRIIYYSLIFVCYFKYVKFSLPIFIETIILYLGLSLIYFLIIHLLRKKYS